MTRVEVRLFGPAREAAKTGAATVELGDGATAADVVRVLGERFPALAGLLPRSRVAVNRACVESSTPVMEGDEVAILPPVGGG